VQLLRHRPIRIQRERCEQVTPYGQIQIHNT
jgi:hypothetical protein